MKNKNLLNDFDQIKKFKFIDSDSTTDDVRIRELEWLAQFIKGDNSLNMEMGVFRGTTINAIAEARKDLTFHGFDSFEGLPEDWDMGSKYVDRKNFDVGGNLPSVRENVVLIKGWFNETLEPFLSANPRPIGFLNIDSDLYSSAIYTLETCNSHIVPGTIIRFDEVCCWRSVFHEASPEGTSNRVAYNTWQDHEWKALNEWLNKYNRRIVPICRNWFQSGTIIVTE